MFRGRRVLRSLQVEVTTRCSLSCAFCPRRHLPEWRDADLTEAAWERVLEGLHLTADVHLQGWGEPLLDAQLPARVRRAHAAGCTVGLTTNGVALAEAARWIADERVDRVAISVGAGAARHGLDRGGPRLDGVWAAVDALARATARRRTRILISVMATRDTVEGFDEIVREAARAGAQEVYATHVDCTPTTETLARTAFRGGRIAPALADAFAAAAREARRAGIVFRAPASHEDDLLVCALDPRCFAFVAADGRVGPCVNMLLPFAGPLVRYDERGTHAVEPVVWGHLPEDTLAGALARRDAFVAPFDARMAAERRFNEEAVDGWGPPALRALESADERRARALADHPFPAACAGCHKASGW